MDIKGMRRRFIESIERLRKAGLFEESSNSAPEGIYEKIRERDRLIRIMEENELERKYWMKRHIYEHYLIFSDSRLAEL